MPEPLTDDVAKQALRAKTGKEGLMPELVIEDGIAYAKHTQDEWDNHCEDLARSSTHDFLFWLLLEPALQGYQYQKALQSKEAPPEPIKVSLDMSGILGCTITFEFKPTIGEMSLVELLRWVGSRLENPGDNHEKDGFVFHKMISLEEFENFDNDVCTNWRWLHERYGFSQEDWNAALERKDNH